jgi:hypothetical protein
MLKEEIKKKIKKVKKTNKSQLGLICQIRNLIVISGYLIEDKLNKTMKLNYQIKKKQSKKKTYVNIPSL